MELYLLSALLLVYILTGFIIQKTLVRRIWTLAFIISFAATALAITLLRINGQDVMMTAGELNWYYLLYLFGSLSVVLGLINMWMYRRALWHILTASDAERDSDDDDDDDN